MKSQNKSRQRIKLQCLVLGAAAAGKTSILRRYFYHTFHQGERVPTLGSDFYTGRVPLKDKYFDVTINLQMWDTPGRERFYAEKQRRQYAASLSDSFFDHADAIMLVYDMTSSTSFTQLLKWYADLMELYKNKPLPILIVANKLDIYNSNQQRASTMVHPRRVEQRDVLGLRGSFRGNDFRYEYRVSPVEPNTPAKDLKKKNRRMDMEIDAWGFLANRENWTTDGSYLDSILNSEDGSSPDREMVLLWCMRNGLTHIEVSAATGEGVNEAMEALVRLALAPRQQESKEEMKMPSQLPNQFRGSNQTLDLHKRYAPKDDRCFFLQPITRWFK